MSEPRFVAVSIDGEIDIHAAIGAGEYTTTCGIDGNDDAIGHVVIPLPASPKRPRITCATCRRMWDAWSNYTSRDFATEPTP